MENQNIKWETWNEQPTENNTNQPQTNWGDQPQQEQPQTNWGDQPQTNWGDNEINSSKKEINYDEFTSSPNQGDNEINSLSSHPSTLDTNYPPQNFNNLNSDILNSVSFLGSFNNINFSTLAYVLKCNNEEAIKEINNSNLKSLDRDSKYILDFESNPELNNIISTIKKVGEERNLTLQHAYLYKINPSESSLNISKGLSEYNFIYFLQAHPNTGEVLLDFSVLNGPAVKSVTPNPGIMTLIPGWIPYRISKNNSETPLLAIGGRFV
jgi:hypothetical protein